MKDTPSPILQLSFSWKSMATSTIHMLWSSSARSLLVLLIFHANRFSFFGNNSLLIHSTCLFHLFIFCRFLLPNFMVQQIFPSTKQPTAPSSHKKLFPFSQTLSCYHPTDNRQIWMLVWLKYMPYFWMSLDSPEIMYFSIEQKPKNSDMCTQRFI